MPTGADLARSCASVSAVLDSRLVVKLLNRVGALRRGYTGVHHIMPCIQLCRVERTRDAWGKAHRIMTYCAFGAICVSAALSPWLV